MIRAAQLHDLESITEIYNQAIDQKFQTAFTDRVTVADRLPWFHEHTGRYPIFVYEAEGEVLGWISIGSYRSGRAALRFTAEVSYFVRQAHTGKGIGSALLEHALTACRELNFKTLLAIILDRNIPSIKLMEKFGFELWGSMPGVADFDGVVCGHVYYGRSLL